MAELDSGHYERHAVAFDSVRRSRFVERPWIDRFLEHIPAGGVILDLGCGAGEPIDRYLIERGHGVVGIDISAPLIAIARGRFPDQDWRVGDMRTVAMDRGFAGIIAWDSLFHLGHDDQRAAIARMSAWLDPDGLLLFNSGPAHGEAIGSQFGEPLYHASLSPEEYRARLEQTDMRVVAHASGDEDAGGRTVWLAQKTR
ncbi:class I SAM-dependent methyltransferase [Sphingomonas sp. HF-S3]|uniref:Class I SAM-dependent methyltransferase n=1 Tax=Sphingomonas rustica TaxID=3103142 RepID=A0ABV0BGN3_9SPHN